jgi:hypothetical protein
MTTPRIDPIDALWDRAEAERIFWEDHYSKFVPRYPDKFVAVHEGEVIASGAELDSVLREVQATGVDRREVWVRFIAATPRTLIL